MIRKFGDCLPDLPSLSSFFERGTTKFAVNGANVPDIIQIRFNFIWMPTPWHLRCLSWSSLISSSYLHAFQVLFFKFQKKNFSPFFTAQLVSCRHITAFFLFFPLLFSVCVFLIFVTVCVIFHSFDSLEIRWFCPFLLGAFLLNLIQNRCR